MKIGQVIREKTPALSFEFFPPKDQAGEDRLMDKIHELEGLHPDFVSVTYGAGGGKLKNTRQLILRILKETSLVPMPHLTCIEQSTDQLKDILEDYKNNGVKKILALRGDPPEGTGEFKAAEEGFCYARDLVKLAASISGFSIAVAVYPEGHCESPDLEKDMAYTKEKIDAGADFAITQMFFDNVYYYKFLERAERVGIRIPILPGIMPITDIGTIKGFAEKCGATIPDRVIKCFEKAGSNKEEARKIGIELAAEQAADLLAHGVPYLHFYTLNQSALIMQIVKGLGLENRAQEEVKSPG